MKKSTLTLILLIITSTLNLLSAKYFWDKFNFTYTANIWCFDINSKNEILVGTGEGFDYGRIYKSSDLGLTWSVFYDFNGELVSRMGITDSDKIYVSKGSQSVVYSDDNGVSWHDIELPPYAYFGINELLCVGNDTVYLGFWEEDGGLLIRTADNGQTWDSLFRTHEHSSEYIGDILVANSNDIYLGLGAYFPNMGGVYKSSDNGQTWEFLGLLNHSISALEVNSNNDLIAGVRGAAGNNSTGIYILRNGLNEWEPLFIGRTIEDLLINNAGHIYFSSSWPSGIGRSTDGGDNFEWLLDGLSGVGIEELLLDNEEFIYAKTPPQSSSSIIFRSSNTTVGINNNDLLANEIRINPNPFENEIFIDLVQMFSAKTHIRIINISGQIVFNQSVSSDVSTIIIPTEHYPSGLYIAQFISNSSTRSYKLVKP